MAILIDKDTRVVIQGATGKQGRYHMSKILDYNVNVVGGVSPGKGGQEILGVPIFDTVAEAQKSSPIDATMIMVPPAGALSAAAEAIESRIALIVVITENVPFHDALRIRSLAQKEKVRVIGPNTVGVISPGKSKVGVSPDSIFCEGSVGIVSRSGTLTHEIASNLTYKGIGQSTCVCIGGDMTKATNFIDVLKLFRDDEQTRVIVMIGEIGGAGEELAAGYIKESSYPKKVVAYIAGATAPAEKKMGHAGAIISGGLGSAESKITNLAAAGVIVAKKMDDVLHIVQ
ncbi:MAG: succinate--CoA ligase subunit alpha [Deltaproteobacteria bacterium]|nr:MAG: succinate--CoA ligase subunit alpha [Deltaproteobacteria bacterium]